jgi:undecaprenyl-diphosphatase
MLSLDTAWFHALYGGPGGGLHGFCVPLMLALTFLGSGWSTLALVPLLASPRTRDLARSLVGVVLVTAAVVFVLKLVVRRPRPCASLQGVAALCRAPTDFSFPSGHAAGSFAVATFLATWLVLRHRAPVPAAALMALAAAIGVSRVYLGVHFPGDVLAGAVIGGLVGALGAVRFARSPQSSSPSPTAPSPAAHDADAGPDIV